MEYACYTCRTIGRTNDPRGTAFLYERLFSFRNKGLAGDVLLCFGLACFCLGFRLQRPGHPHRALGVVPDLLIREIAEDRCEKQEHRHRNPRSMPGVEVW